jgi:Lamin Tail Domain
MRKSSIVIGLVSLSATCVFIACSEANSNSPDGGNVVADSGGNKDSSVGLDQASPDATKPEFDASACGNAIADAASLPVVVNEIRAKGKEFVEIFNPTNASIDLSGTKVADAVGADGCPKTSEALVFPPNTSIPAGGYIAVFTGQTDASNAAQTACFDAGPATCYYANYKISNTTGETLFVLTASDAVVTNGYYPPAAADSGQSWARLPNGTGNFTVSNTPTPGAANQP